MKKNDAIYEEDVQLYDRTDDFDENCDSTEEEIIYTEETDYDNPEEYNSTTVAFVGTLVITIFCFIVFSLCSKT